MANDSDSAPAAVSTVNVRAPNADREMWLQSMQASATRMPKAGIKHQTRPLREVSKLKDLCTTVVAGMFWCGFWKPECGKEGIECLERSIIYVIHLPFSSLTIGLLTSSTTTAKAYLHALPGASSGVTELLLARLIETRKLDRIVLAGLVNHWCVYFTCHYFFLALPFIYKTQLFTILAAIRDRSYLPTVKLDSYTLATDSLLDTLGTSQSAQAVAKLSLRGCDVITDKGVAALEGEDRGS